VRLTVVGCAGSAPGPGSACSCYLIERDGYRLLLDLGTGAAGPLQRYAPADGIDAVIVSHAHGDHWSDLIPLGYLRGTVSHSPPLPVTGPSDLPAVIQDNPDVYTPSVAVPEVRAFGPLAVRQARVDHGDCECWATRVGDELCYTADTGPCEALDKLANGCTTLLAEASGLETDGSLPRHLTAGDAGRLAARSGATLLILTHLRPWQDHTALLNEATRHAPCPVLLATPGLRLAL
jgi:ribonuclease BN (tRNA processing enzyme)